MVERQPEKLKVVGSNPIPDIMLFLVLWFLFLVLNDVLIVIFFNQFFLIFYILLYVLRNYTVRKVTFLNIPYCVINTINFLKYVLLKDLYHLYNNFKFKNNQLRWKPLFKKSSYFGIYRANTNKWLNK